MDDNQNYVKEYNKACGFTDNEWKKMLKILNDLNCPNISYLTRMIIHGYISVNKNNEISNSIDSGVDIIRRRTNLYLSPDNSRAFETIKEKYNCTYVNQFFRDIANKKLLLKQIKQYPDDPISHTKVQRSGYRAGITLQFQEGEAFKRICRRNGCENPSQLCKKIVNNELVPIKRELLNQLLKTANKDLKNEINELLN